ncbi:MAG: DUF4058 family protein [Planctomycetes bacterium]|nr:DUF4058 family protein [Planctomycetota bacterium]
MHDHVVNPSTQELPNLAPGTSLLVLGELLAEIYDRARYDLCLDYRRPPIPRLSSDDSSWAAERLRR